MTPAQALALVRYQINETSAKYWTDAEIYAYLWQGEHLLAGVIGYQQASTDHTTVTDTSEYTMPDDTVRIARVTWDGKKLKRVQAVDIDYLDGTDYGSTIDSGQPEVYREWNDKITLYPTPNTDATLKFEFLKAPAQIVTDSTVFSILDPVVQQMIPDYAVWQCLIKDEESNGARQAAAKWETNLRRAYSIRADRDIDEINCVRDEDQYAGGVLGMD